MNQSSLNYTSRLWYGTYLSTPKNNIIKTIYTKSLARLLIKPSFLLIMLNITQPDYPGYLNKIRYNFKSDS